MFDFVHGNALKRTADFRIIKQNPEKRQEFSGHPGNGKIPENTDKCKDSCCIGWEIMIDSKSYKKYQNVKGEFRDRLMKGIDHEGTPAFHLDDRDRCVFLNQKNLCDIYIEL